MTRDLLPFASSPRADRARAGRADAARARRACWRSSAGRRSADRIGCPRACACAGRGRPRARLPSAAAMARAEAYRSCSAPRLRRRLAAGGSPVGCGVPFASRIPLFAAQHALRARTEALAPVIPTTARARARRALRSRCLSGDRHAPWPARPPGLPAAHARPLAASVRRGGMSDVVSWCGLARRKSFRATRAPSSRETRVSRAAGPAALLQGPARAARRAGRRRRAPRSARRPPERAICPSSERFWAFLSHLPRRVACGPLIAY